MISDRAKELLSEGISENGEQTVIFLEEEAEYGRFQAVLGQWPRRGPGAASHPVAGAGQRSVSNRARRTPDWLDPVQG